VRIHVNVRQKAEVTTATVVVAVIDSFTEAAVVIVWKGFLIARRELLLFVLQPFCILAPRL
jgi:hypothetical protein